MKTLIATLVAATLTATPALAGEFGETAAAPYQSEQVATVAGIGQSGSSVIDGTVDSGQATDESALPAGGALGQGPASVTGQVPTGSRLPTVGAGGILNDR
jgi:hypothetical protein